MWRAFFFAVGIMLIILGLECLVAERFIVSQGRIPDKLARLLDGDSAQTSPPAINSFSQANRPPLSNFGPSRFDDAFGGSFQQSGNYYGGQPSMGQPNGNQPFSLAGFGSPTQSNNPGMAPPPAFMAPRKTTVLTPKDWMPWSLLAAGSLVVLYTNTTARRGFSSE